MEERLVKRGLFWGGVSIDGLDRSILRYAALHWAVRADDPKCTVMPLDLGANPDVSCGVDERAPLHVAASRCHPEAIIILLDQRAGINERDHHNWTPLHYAIDSRRAAAVHLLTRGGAAARSIDPCGKAAKPSGGGPFFRAMPYHVM